jgi:hypothetical protein
MKKALRVIFDIPDDAVFSTGKTHGTEFWAFESGPRVWQISKQRGRYSVESIDKNNYHIIGHPLSIAAMKAIIEEDEIPNQLQQFQP